jgi:hypothetical protein
MEAKYRIVLDKPVIDNICIIIKVVMKHEEIRIGKK